MKVNTSKPASCHETRQTTYLVPVTWSMYGRVEVQASSPEEAFQIALEKENDFDLPDGYYLEDSFEIDTDGILMDEDGNILD